MADRGFIYTFEGIGDDLARPPMSALRALLSAGVVVSARTWQELDLGTRRAFAKAGAEDVIHEMVVAELVRRIPVAQVKLVGKRVDPDSRAVPTELAIALGPARPLAAAEWSSLRVLDRHVLTCLVKNTRLLAKALHEILPAQPGAGSPNSWSGAVARSELRMRKDVLHRVLSVDFYDGNGFTLASVAGRRAARRASEIFDQQADATVGPVELEWGLRSSDDVLFWQAHVSDWDGTFFPAAALLAATTAAAAMYDMVKGLDSGASIVFSGIREEPWQAGRDEQHDAPTALYSAGGHPKHVPLHDTVRDDAALRHPRAAIAPPARPSGPGLPASPPVAVPTPRSSSPGSSGTPGSARSDAYRQAPSTAVAPRPRWLGAALVSALVLANLVVILAIALVLTRHH